MKSQTFSNGYKPVSPLLGAGPFFAAVAISLMAMAPACLAQQASSRKPPKVTIVEAASAPGGLGSVTRAASDTKTLHVTVGHSLFIDTETRLRRVYVADPAVLNSVTLTPNEIIVTAMTPGISSLTLLDDVGQAQSYVISSDIDIDGLRQAMAQAIKGNSVKVEGSGGRVTLSGIVANQAMADDAVKLATLYSKEVADAMTIVPVHLKQVRLEVRILEVDRSKLLQLGVNLFNPGGNTNFLATTTTSQYPSTATLSQSTGSAIGTLTTSSPLNFLLYSAKLNLGATIQDLQTKQVLQILAEPTITTVSGVKADFLSGGEFPFPIVQPGTGGSSPVVTISFRPYGVKVEFTPVVNDDGTITLTVAPEVSALDYSNSVSISGFTVPALSTRRASTEVELRSNQSFAISGLLDQRTTDIMSKTPGIASIPIIGDLFKSKNVNHSTTELVVVVTPTVVDPLTESAEPVQPDLPIPTLDTGKFDKSLGKDASPKPAAPPIPDSPPFGTQAPPAASPSSSVPAPTPVTTQQNVKTPAKMAPAIANPNASATTAASELPHELVEIMTLSHESDADAMVAALDRHGYNVAVRHDPQDSLLHLDVGPFASAKDAQAMQQRLLLDGYNATIKQ